MITDEYFDQIPIASTVVDPKGHIVAVNRAFCGLFGVSPDHVIGDDVLSMYPSVDAGWAREVHRRLFLGELANFRSSGFFVTATGNAERLQVVICPTYSQAFDSTDRSDPTDAPPTRDTEGPTPTGAIYTFDYGPANAFSDTDSYLQRVMKASRSTLLTLDGNGIVTSVAGSGGAGLAYPSGFWEGRAFTDIVLTDERPRFRGYLATLADHPSVLEDTELRVKAADGSERVVLLSGANMLDDPIISAVVLSVQDVSELHEQITDLVEETRTAELLAAQRAEMIATVSHELRNPLHALQGLSELLAGADLPSDLHDIAAELNTQLVGLATVTSDLLEAARAERGSIQLVPEPIELSTLLQRAVRYGQATVTSKPVEVTGVLEPNTPEAVMLDPARFDQVVRNLVGNAAKFIKEGTITITIGKIPRGIHFTVADTGPGIPGAELGTILEPFARGTNTVEATGAGLGLAIVNDLVRSMGGRVIVDSVVGRGATFRAEVKAPRSVAVPSVSADQADTSPIDADVLVVDDDRTNRVIATRMLERLGCRVAEAHSGEQAIEMLKAPRANFPVDIVLMDRRMPGMDGLETTRALREIPHRSDIYVVGLSASTSPDERAECAAASMDDFIAKPASVADLQRAVLAGLDEGEQQTTQTAASPATAANEKAGERNTAREPNTDEAVLVDTHRIEELVEEFDDAELVQNLIQMFIDDLPVQLDAIATARSEGEFEALGRLAHTIKGSALMLGAPRLAEVAKAMEKSPGDAHDSLASIADITIHQYRRLLDDPTFGEPQ